jgi:hypothetical protein
MSWSLEDKNASTFLNFLRHGKETVLNDIADFKFTDVIFDDGTVLKDVTFEQLANTVWSLVSKNSATFTNETRN